jgi:hypothetical protein
MSQGEDSTKKLWDNFLILYQLKSLVNKLFLINKLYLLRMSDGSSVTEHLNAFNTILIQLSSVDIKITEEEKCISLLCSFLDSWDSLVVAIRSNTTTLVLEGVVSSLLSEEMRRKNMEGSIKYDLVVRGDQLKEIKGNSPVEILSQRVDQNPWFSRQEDVGNVVKMGITKRTVSRG